MEQKLLYKWQKQFIQFPKREKKSFYHFLLRLEAHKSQNRRSLLLIPFLPLPFSPVTFSKEEFLNKKSFFPHSLSLPLLSTFFAGRPVRSFLSRSCFCFLSHSGYSLGYRFLLSRLRKKEKEKEREREREHQEAFMFKASSSC